MSPSSPSNIARSLGRSFQIKVRGIDRVIDVDPSTLNDHEDGLRGSILSILLSAGIELDHTCGGVLACSTCHIYVEKGGNSASDPTDEEEDQLDFSPALRPGSRLACQCVPDGSEDIEVEVPSWNRNEVSEDPH